MINRRFSDENKRISDFDSEVWVACPQCQKKAVARAFHDHKKARLNCLHCGYNKEISTEIVIMNMKATLRTAAHTYFDARLWLQHPFRNNVFFAFNEAHLLYLEAYIGAGLREHQDRTHFTLLEKLPKFYHEAKNRKALLRIIAKLKTIAQ